MANPTALSEIAATTISNYQKKMADNFSETNALLAQISKSGNKQYIDGGDKIVEQFSFAENANTGSYSGSEVLPTGSNETMGAATYDIKQYVSTVVMSGLERLQNAGEERLIDLVVERVSNAEGSLRNLMGRHVYLDGTGNGGKNLTGLGAALTLTPTTGSYGNVSRANVNVWRQKAIDASTTTDGVVTAANINKHFNNMWAQIMRGTDVPNMIILDVNYWNAYMASLQAQQRFATPEKGELGFSTLKFQQCDVYLENTPNSIAANTALFLNTKYLKLRPHRDGEFVSKKRDSQNQDADATFILWAGNMTCRGLRFQGIIQD